MLEDRDYMRDSSRSGRWSATVVLLIANLVAFLLQISVLNKLVPLQYLVLSVEGLSHGFIWQVITFQFLHAGWVHLIFNSLAIYMFGRSVEAVIGRFRFLQLYFASGILGGLLQMLLALIAPNTFGGAVVGASAGGAGLIGAFAVINWHQRFTLFLYFIPVNMRGRTLLWLSVVIAVIGMFDQTSMVAHAAHLGGILTGAAFLRLGLGLHDLPFGLPGGRRRRGPGGSPLRPRWPRGDNPKDVPEGEFISREVDPILEKISAHGIQSLTEEERKILEAARNRMAKR